MTFPVLPNSMFKDQAAIEKRLSELERSTQANGVPIVSALPSTASDGQTITFQTTTMAADGVAWNLRYRALNPNGTANTNVHKWEFVGGSGWYKEVLADETVGTSATWVDLTTVGPQVTVPLTGYYRVESSALAHIHNRLNTAFIGVSDDNATPVDPIMRADGPDTGGGWVGGMKIPMAQRAVLGIIDANSVLKLRYWYTTAGSGTFRWRTLTVTPIRVGLP